MVDTWATVGSCAQIGKNVHLSGGVGIGGVLEPLQANPTIIEDNCFVGARSEIVEGVIVEENSVISMGVYIGQSTKIYDRETGRRPLRPRPGRLGRGLRLPAVARCVQPVLRRHRQEGHGLDPGQDDHQRVAARHRTVVRPRGYCRITRPRHPSERLPAHDSASYPVSQSSRTRPSGVINVTRTTAGPDGRAQGLRPLPGGRLADHDQDQRRVRAHQPGEDGAAGDRPAADRAPERRPVP